MIARTRRDACFVAVVLVSIVLYWKPIGELVSLAFSDESYSHILLIPFLSLFLLYTERKTVFLETRWSLGFGTTLIVVGVIVYWPLTSLLFSQNPSHFIFGAALSLVSIWIGGFIACYGERATRAALFPLLFLLLMVPLPDEILAWTVHLLQQGSTAVAYVLFKAVGIPVLRQGFLLTVPGVTIEVATECSGIRSSMALLVTCLLAAHFFLRTPWKMLLFVVVSLPLAVIKNGIRIATLTILSIHVDPSFLHGHLHRDGGFVFFVLALAILAPVLLLLQKSERFEGSVNLAARKQTESGLARA
jgi:exosortase